MPGSGIELAKAYVQIVPTADGISSGLEKVLGQEGENAGQTLGSKFSGTLGKLGTAALKGIGVAAGAAATAAGKLMTDSVKGFAEFEQLTGGVETLFKDSADVVMNYANNAYKTAGLSANAYMETVTSFSASLLQSVGGDTEKAAAIADQAIIDMSDNANKMGTSMESIQTAYQGFAKANFTMLDNLKLGYGGTKEEMQRLLEDATALSGVEFDISSYADIVEAIHVVQDNLGITGTTAKEASETISGSIAATKAAWSNLIVGLTDENADVGKLVDNLVDSATTAIQNLIPAASRALKGITKLLGEIGPVLADQIPEIIESLLPPLVTAAINLVAGLIKNLPRIIASLLKALYEVGKTLLESLWDGIVNAAKRLLEKLGAGFKKIIDWIKNFFGIKSSGSIWESIGASSAAGFGTGWAANISGVNTQLQQDVSRMVASGYWTAEGVGFGSGYAGRSSNTYNVTIDARNVREFNDVVNYAQNAARLGRQYG